MKTLRLLLEQLRKLRPRLCQLHPPTHSWRRYEFAVTPKRPNFFCELRQCRVCGLIEYLSFATFGDGKWHALNDPSGCQPWEWEGIKQAAQHTCP